MSRKRSIVKTEVAESEASDILKDENHLDELVSEQQDLHNQAASSKAFQSQKASQVSSEDVQLSIKGMQEAHEEELQVLNEQIVSLADESQRAQANIVNMRRRTAEEVKNARKYGTNDLLVQLIPIVDSIEHSIYECIADEHIKDDKRMIAICKGNELVLGMMLDIFAKFGVKQVDPLGEVFDPMQHEAISKRKDKSVKPDTVVEVFRKGYCLHDRVVRSAMVVIADGSS